MSKHEWKVGDRVRIKPEFYDAFPEYDPHAEYIVEGVDQVGDPEIPCEGNFGYFFKDDAEEVFDIL